MGRQLAITDEQARDWVEARLADLRFQEQEIRRKREMAEAQHEAREPERAQAALVEVGKAAKELRATAEGAAQFIASLLAAGGEPEQDELPMEPPSLPEDCRPEPEARGGRIL